MAKRGTQKKVYACWFAGRESEAIFFNNWEECSVHVKGVPNILYRSFSDRENAQKFLSSSTGIPNTSSSEDPSTLSIYVDGSFISSNEHAGWAWVIIGSNSTRAKSNIIREDAGVSTKPAVSRNVDGEILATLKAMSWVVNRIEDFTKADTPINQIYIYHDYNGISNWATGEWKAKTELTRAYRDSMNKYTEVLRKHAITLKFHKVVAHSGNDWNEYVDKKARAALLHHNS